MRKLRNGLLGIAAIATAMLLARPLVVLADEVDEDADGVVDTIDDCPDTPPGDLVSSDGCSVCPCEATVSGDPWASRDAYLRCVADELKARRRGRSINRKASRDALRAAKKSSCGNEDLTRCCIYPDSDADTVVGQCRITTVDKCDQLSNDLPWAEDSDPGSCLPNPCIF